MRRVQCGFVPKELCQELCPLLYGSGWNIFSYMDAIIEQSIPLHC